MRYSTLRQLPDTLTPIDGVLIKRQPLTQAARAERLIAEAKRRAKQLVCGADRDAHACRELAALSGYESGFARAVEMVVACLEQLDRYRATLHERAVDAIRDALEALLDDSSIVLRITEALTSHHLGPKEGSPRVLVPERAKQLAPVIRERLSATYPSVQVAISGSSSFVIEWGAEILEFAPGDTVSELCDTARITCRAVAHSINEVSLTQQIVGDALLRLEARHASPGASSEMHQLTSHYTEQDIHHELNTGHVDV
ncbi:HrpE/YscL family type III secretion apparatus protein [Burkholderia ubonensis]|uniref:HrpE/YscL family type III secretion apparatus protein n=1 Tax=Burkholderia ubonensis TaxID=101571 RepID=UPI0009B43E73|nr:HrpE/YscL family type III secretion apparatus protein [Burkholderia ubonensis]